MGTQANTEDLGLRVDALRSSLGITVQRLAADSLIASTTIERRLAGDGKLTVAELSRISAALNVSPASWFEAAA